ncbi:MAG: HAMP domain-containing histidine kinase [Candidatus Tectomicrobia bacterium]|uniref:histidine kinase n=1 Tax=Tectimicrobiota bacterium TaxID=2528274 RepID=A0A932CQS8_UNCTE|nr:HAMP domain-containing histidine kinase [Candidatus Tectomicrobia bacterium]
MNADQSMDEFAGKIRAMRACVAFLQQCSNELPLPSREASKAAIEELYATLEELQASQEAIRQQHEDLIRNRTAQLETDNQRKDQFLSMLAHELRNPLNVILSTVELLKLPQLSEPGFQRVLKILERQVCHQASLLDDLFDLSRIVRGKISPRRKLLDLADLARNSAEDWEETLAREGLTLTLELPEGPVWVRGDPIWLFQALGNLLQNALKFTDPGGQVTLRVKSHPATRQAIITVRDTGMGIAPEMLPHLFEMFAQADPGPDRGRGGLGLGLALVKHLVEQHGGTVCAHSEGPGQGAEFTLQLPLRQSFTEDPP